jgi:hypothetical protein
MNLFPRLPTHISFNSAKEDIIIEMGIGEKGLKYEKKVQVALEKASQDKRISNKLTDVSDATGNNCTDPDITFTYAENKINVEIKSKFDDPLGNFSIRTILGESDFDLSNESLSERDKSALKEILASKKDAIDDYIKFARKQEPRSYNSKINQFPMYISKSGADAARERGLAKAIADYSTKDEFDINAIFGLYNSGKNTYYIQIGGYGLYALGFDRYKLGVPVLEGKCIVEIRPFSSGLKERKDKKTGKTVDVVSMGLRVSPRLTEITNQSKYTLDDVSSIIELLY